MVHTYQPSARRAQCSPWVKNRVWGIFGDPDKATTRNRRLNGEMSRENPRYGYESVLGVREYIFRHYNPQTGTWLNRDPIQEKGGTNLYAFGLNRTLNVWDRLGLDVEEIWPDELCTFTIFIGHGITAAVSNALGIDSGIGAPIEEHDNAIRTKAAEIGGASTSTVYAAGSGIGCNWLGEEEDFPIEEFLYADGNKNPDAFQREEYERLEEMEQFLVGFTVGWEGGDDQWASPPSWNAGKNPSLILGFDSKEWSYDLVNQATGFMNLIQHNINKAKAQAEKAAKSCAMTKKEGATGVRCCCRSIFFRVTFVDSDQEFRNAQKVLQSRGISHDLLRQGDAFRASFSTNPRNYD